MRQATFDFVSTDTERKQTKSEEAGGHVYFYLLKGTALSGIFKIGKAIDLHARISDFRVSKTDDCQRLAYAVHVRSPGMVEEYFHNLFKGKRLRGEQFHLSSEDVAFVRKKLSDIGRALNDDEVELINDPQTASSLAKKRPKGTWTWWTLSSKLYKYRRPLFLARRRRWNVKRIDLSDGSISSIRLPLSVKSFEDAEEHVRKMVMEEGLP